MSFGRNPYYIWSGKDYIFFTSPHPDSPNGDKFPYPRCKSGDNEQINSVHVPREAVQQFVAHLAARGTDELQSWIDAGALLNRDWDGWIASRKDFLSLDIIQDEIKDSKWLRTKVKVKRRFRRI